MSAKTKTKKLAKKPKRRPVKVLPPVNWQPTPRHAGGRPSDYKLKYCQEIIEYFDIPPYTRIMTMWGPKDMPNPLPTLAGFAARIGVDEDTLGNWCKSHPEFFGAVTKAKAIQKHILVTNGLMGGYNSRFATLVATNFTDLKLPTSDPPPLAPAVINIFELPKRYAPPAIGQPILTADALDADSEPVDAA